MNQHSKWIASAVATVTGLAIAGSAGAQGVTGDTYLDNIAPGSVSAYYSAWGSQPPTVVSSLGTGLEIVSAGYGSLYYAIPSFQRPASINAADTQVSLTFTINGPAGSYYVGVPFIVNDNSGAVAYGGYSTFGQGTWTETVPLSTAQRTAVATGSDVIYGINLEFDPAGNVPGGNYDITFNSLTLTPVPEPGTLGLVGLGVAAIFAVRRRNK